MSSIASSSKIEFKSTKFRLRRRTIGAIDEWNHNQSLSNSNETFNSENAGFEDNSSRIVSDLSEESTEEEQVEICLVSGCGRTRKKKRSKLHERSKSVGDGSWSRLAAEQLQRTDDSLFGVDLRYSSSRDSLSDDSSVPSTPSTGPSTSNSNRSSPCPSECEYELKGMDTSSLKTSRWESDNSSMGLQLIPGSLKRRHTLPERPQLRTTAISFTIVSPELSPITLSSVSKPFLYNTSGALPQFTFIVTILTISLSLINLISPIPILPASPVHLLRSPSYRSLEYINILLAPFLVTASSSAILLAFANLASLKSLDDNHNKFTLASKGGVAILLWVAIVTLRVTLCWLFGRVLGWAHPVLFSTSAIHEVGSGLAPLLLSLQIIQAATSSSTIHPSQIAMLGANFFTPIEYGGTGLWWGISSAIIGLVASGFIFAYQFLTLKPQSIKLSKRSTSSRKVSWRVFLTLLAMLSLPLLSNFSAKPPPTRDITTSFANLHPSQPHLLTILLLTAPRPGNPNYLYQTIESWLGALPSRSESPVADRIRLIVYTHFESHQVFDSAQEFFSTSPLFAEKAQQYLSWHRDPRGIANRLDQRLHVARGLDYASHYEGESAYVLLTEDDFPLCPNEEGTLAGQQRWDQTWSELERLFVDTNLAMPDFTTSTSTTSSSSSTTSSSNSSHQNSEETSGHCGIFFSTGGSGLAIRGFIAAQLPSLLLGADDPQGTTRDHLASLGELYIPSSEGPDSDTPDVVIQDCLRGSLPGCEICAPPISSLFSSSSTRNFPTGSKRNQYVVNGERWGKSGLVATERLLQHHLGFNASTLPGRKYGQEEWSCGWRQPFNGSPDILVV